MKRLVALSLLMMLLVNTASAESWGDLFGGLTSLFSSKDEVTYGTIVFLVDKEQLEEAVR